MINLLAAIVLNGLVVFIVTYFLTSLEGPWDVFKRLREWAGIQHDADGFPEVIKDRFLARLLACFWCTATWVSMATSLLAVFTMGASWYTSWYMWVCLWLASIASAGLVNKVVTHES
jgi:hypothetical protein